MTNHTTSPELSKKLKELGVPQDSMFYWYKKKWTRDEDRRLVLGGSYEEQMYEAEMWEKECSAFLSSELGELLPSSIRFNNKTYYLVQSFSNYTGGVIGYEYDREDGITEHLILQSGDTEVDARGRLLEYLLENKIIEL